MPNSTITATRASGVKTSKSITIIQPSLLIENQKKGYDNTNGGKIDGLVYGETHELKLVKSDGSVISIPKGKSFEWKCEYECDGKTVTIEDWGNSQLLDCFFDKQNMIVEFKVDDLEWLGKTLTFSVSHDNFNSITAEIDVWVHYRFRLLKWTTVEIEMNERLTNPWKVNQNGTSLCGVACLVYLLAKHDCSGYSTLVTDLHHKGEAYYKGYKIKPHEQAEETMYVMDDSGSDYPSNWSGSMPLVDWLTLATLRSKESSTLPETPTFDIPFTDVIINLNNLNVYCGIKENNSTDQFAAINWPWMMSDLCKNFLGYSDIQSKGLEGLAMALIPTKRVGLEFLYFDLEDLKEMDNLYNQGYKIIMMIDANMLYNKLADGPLSLFTSTHWIVYEGNLKFFDKHNGSTKDLGIVKRVSFDLFTWGEDTKLSRISDDKNGIFTSVFQNTLYGYIACK